MGLCGFGALLGLCGFCAREVFGGLKACGEFASILSLSPMFYLFCIRFSSSSPFFCPLSCPFAPAFIACPLVLCLSSLSLWVVVSFSLADVCAKRKDAKCCSLRPLLSCCVLLYLVAALYSSYSSGVNPFIS